jgi:hypothetical protein
VEDNFLEVVGERTAGDPESDAVWTDLSPRQVAERLQELGTPVGEDTARKLFGHFGLGRRKTQKSLPMGEFAQRDEQFLEIARWKKEFLASPNPILSMDTKKKEHLGNFHREGRLYSTGVLHTLDHDFHPAGSLVIPHGVYDLKRNRGHLVLGTSHDTSEFAVDCLLDWWLRYGQRAYADATSLLLLCDCGGSNGYRQHVFKEQLQRLADRTDLKVRVAHYPPYCSKYNPIEHRFFSHVTRACQGAIFHTLDVVKDLMSRTCTSTGLKTTVNVITKVYETARKASDEFLESYRVKFSKILPELNYALRPMKC